jgi:hypothetical protein
MAIGIKEFVQRSTTINLAIESVTPGQSNQPKKSGFTLPFSYKYAKITFARDTDKL